MCINIRLRLSFAIYSLCIALPFLLSSCSGDDYVNAVPGNSIALVSIDLRKMAAESTGNEVDNGGLLNALLRAENAGDCGIDLSEKIFMFESAEGNLGLVAKLKSASKLEKWLENLSNAGVCKNVTERNGYRFAVLKDSWVIGSSSGVMMVMGPVIASQQAEVQQQMMKYLSQDEEKGIKGTPIYDKLDSLDSPVALVARAKALPEKFVAPFMIGAPKDADASQIVIAAELRTGSDGLIRIKGETFSFNKNIDSKIKASHANYRPITGEFLENIPSASLFALFLNVDGSRYISMLNGEKSVQVLLAGLNTAIDMDNIIRSIDGDLVIAASGYDADMLQVQMGAKLKKRDFLGDVGYWKQSCPKGGTITDWDKDAYCYKSGELDFYFGVSADNRFYGGSTASMARDILRPSSSPFTADVRNAMLGQRMGMLLNIEKITEGNEPVRTAMSLLVPVLGKVNTVLYTMK